jgi:hypothetical protein
MLNEFTAHQQNCDTKIVNSRVGPTERLVRQLQTKRLSNATETGADNLPQ